MSPLLLAASTSRVLFQATSAGSIGLLAAVVCVSFGVEAALGFGSTVLAVTLAAPLLALELLLPTLVGLNLIVSAYIVIRHRDGIAWRLLLTRILPLAGLGMPLGMLLFSVAGGPALKIGFGAFVCLLSAVELWRQRGEPAAGPPLPLPATAGLLLLGGIVHGLYASGGPMVVYVTSRLLADKRRFRSTLSMLWLILNAVLLIGYAARGLIGTGVLVSQAVLLPTLGIGIVSGEWVHRRVDERVFRRLIYLLLLIGGGVLVTTSLR